MAVLAVSSITLTRHRPPHLFEHLPERKKWAGLLALSSYKKEIF